MGSISIIGLSKIPPSAVYHFEIRCCGATLQRLWSSGTI
jgi:hypothetical protein